MRDTSDVLTVSFDSGLKDESALCVTRKCGEKIIMLKMELGEQADILYHLLTEQMTKAEIKALEQKLCEDCISRQWLMECINEGWIKFDTERDTNRFIHLIRDMAPPVTPQPETQEVEE